MKGAREIVKKLALRECTAMEVLVVYTGIAFLMVAPQYKNAMGLEPRFYIYIAIKSFVIFLAWILGFKAISRLPLSVYAILDLSRVLFATMLGVVVLNEVMGLGQYIGLVLVSTGLVLLKYRPKKIVSLLSGRHKGSGETADAVAVVSGNTKADEEEMEPLYVICALLSCVLNAVSGLLDKILMKDISSTQLQFWYMLILLAFYLIFTVVTRTKISVKSLTNKWIWLLSLMFVLADKALFVANSSPDSKITMMTLIKQSACIVTILGGKLVFKEKNIAYKLFCAAVIVIGILFGTIL